MLSEKNHAVDAIASSLLRRGGGEPGNEVWEETTAHGVAKSLGSNCKKFFVAQKAKNDPSVKKADEEVVAAKTAVRKAESGLREVVHANKDLVIAAADKVKATWEDIYTVRSVDEKRFISVSDACKEHENDAEIMAHILCDVLPMTTAGAVRRARDMIDHELQAVVQAKGHYDTKTREREVALKRAEERLRKNTVIVLSTLGSSHGMMSALGLRDDDEDVCCDNAEDDTSATIICDEASTVHSALFIGALEKLSAQVKIINILIIGDDRQLPPYWPLQDSKLQPTALYSMAADVAAATKLKHQYRMPRFAMDILNRHFYSDMPLIYAKVDAANPDDSHPVWIDIPCAAAAFINGAGRRGDPGRGRGGGRGRGARDDVLMARRHSEESREEADKVLQQAMHALKSGQSVLITTPYRRQKTLIERMALQHDDDEFSFGTHIKDGSLVVTTVDGGQGQEADVLIISMVKRYPSKFLDPNRLCVMLSRGRRRLVIVGDRNSHLGCDCKPVAEVAQMSKSAAGKGKH